jgi:hypothetical protein
MAMLIGALHTDAADTFKPFTLKGLGLVENL